MTTASEEEIEFMRQFEGRAFGTKTRTGRRLKSEKRAQMTEKQLSRGGRIRTEQQNFRCTPAHKALTARVAAALGISQADTLERAVQEFAKANGVEPDA